MEYNIYSLGSWSLDTPDADERVGVAGKQSIAIGAPGQGDTGRGGASGAAAAGGEEVLSALVEVGDDALGFEIPDADAIVGGSAQPVAVGAEAHGVDDGAGIEGVQVLALGEVPQHRSAVLAAGGAQAAVGADGDGVDVAGVAAQVGEELELAEVPDLHGLVPAART